MVIFLFLHSASVGRPDQVEASSAHGERFYPRQRKGESSLLNMLQGSDERDSKGETVPKETVGSGGLELRGTVRRYRNV